MKEIQLTRGQIAFVDDEDFEKLNQFNWQARICPQANTYYAGRSILNDNIGKRTSILMHRVILNITDTNIRIDHKDRNGLNNTKDNLRIVTHMENSMNAVSRKNNLSSSFKGVTKRNSSYSVQVAINKVKYSIGGFNSDIEAAKVYDAIVRFYYPEVAYTNFNEIFIEPLDIESAKLKFRNPSKEATAYKVLVYDKTTNILLDRLTVNEISAKYNIKTDVLYVIISSKKSNTYKNLKLIKENGT